MTSDSENASHASFAYPTRYKQPYILFFLFHDTCEIRLGLSMVRSMFDRTFSRFVDALELIAVSTFFVTAKKEVHGVALTCLRLWPYSSACGLDASQLGPYSSASTMLLFRVALESH